MERKHDRTPVGRVRLVMQEIEGESLPEIGWMIHRRLRRPGFASAAPLAVLAAAFGRFGYPRVISLVRPENVPSQGVARNLGMAPLRETTYVGLRHVVWGVGQDARGRSLFPDSRPATFDS